MPKKGKKGTDQRIKGNVKAASSGRMVELFGNEGFIGFDAVTGGTSSDGSLSDEVLFGISNSFQIVLKQLGKRDTTTKIKALNEFIVLCDNECLESVTSCLKLWPLMYNKLSMDNDHRIRELTHRALQCCSVKVKKHLGPHIKTIIGCWVSGMCDPNIQSSITAKTAFSMSFSPDKYRDVYKFGLKDILMHVNNMVLKETPDTYTDPKIFPEDERIERYDRAVAMAILGFGYTLQQLDSQYLQEDSVSMEWQSILKEGRLWKLTKHNNPVIRSSVYSLVVCLVKCCIQYIEEDPKLFCSLVLGSLGESDPIVIGPLWEAVLHVIGNIKDWPEHVNIQKGLLPGLWYMFDGGGFGCAKLVYPCLLPLLIELIKVYSEDEKFVLNFLDRFSKSVLSDHVRISSTETQLIINSFNECCEFIINNGISNIKTNEETSFLNNIIDIVLGILDHVMSFDLYIQNSVLCIGVAMVIQRSLNTLVTREYDVSHLMKYVSENLKKKLFARMSVESNIKVYDRISDILCPFYTPQKISLVDEMIPVLPSHNIEMILPVICEVCGICLVQATLNHILLLQRLLRGYTGSSKSLIPMLLDCIKEHWNVDELINYMISLCDEDDDKVLLIIDCVISLIYTEGSMDILIKTSKHYQQFIPLILLKLSERDYSTDLCFLSKEVTSFLIPSDTLHHLLLNKYFREFLKTMLTSDGNKLLRDLPLCKTIVELLVIDTCKEMDVFIIDILSLMDSHIIKSNISILVRLLQHLLDWIVRNLSSKVHYSVWQSVIKCYTHIISHHNDLLNYYNSLSPFLLKSMKEAHDINHAMLISLCIKCLHTHVHSLLGSIFNPFTTTLIQTADNEIEGYLSLESYRMFCDGDLLYTPSIYKLCYHMPSTLYHVLLTAVCITDHVTTKEIFEECGNDTNIKYMLSLLNDSHVLVSDISNDVWRSAVLCYSALCIITKNSSIEYTVCNSALDMMLKYNNKWLLDLIQHILDRCGLSQCSIFWSMCINHILRCSDGICSDELCELISDNSDKCNIQLVLHDILFNETILHDRISQYQQDPCVIAGYSSLIKHDIIELNQFSSSLLNLIAEKHSSKELNIFEDPVESCNDPMSFSVLQLMTCVNNESLLSNNTWDFIMCQIISLIQLLSDNYDNLSHGGVILFCRGLNLSCKVNSIISESFPQYTEWKEFFLPAIQDTLFPIFMRIKGSIRDVLLEYPKVLLHYHICKVMDDLLVDPPAAQLEELVSMVTSCQLYSEQFTSFRLAQRVIQSMNIDCDNKGSSNISSIQSCLGSVLFQVDLDSVFNEDETSVDIVTHHVTVSYLMIWILICETVGKCQMETRVMMTEWIKETSQLNHLLHGVFQYCSLNQKGIDTLKLTLVPSLNTLCTVMYMYIARHLPPMLRQWYNELDRNMSTGVSSFTSSIVSPVLWNEEVLSMQKSNTKIGNLEVKVYSGVKEVLVMYTVDEFRIELSICVPESYPLLAPTIREGRKAKVDITLWRKWLLQLSAFVANQNGSLMDGLLLWKSNLDKHFAGLEDCMICFSIIHGSNYSLPKMCCRTCKKKYHSTCLYKWFNTSAKSTCPLCRNVF